MMGGIHFFPAFKFRRDLKFVRVRESSRLFGHFLPPFGGGLKGALRAKKIHEYHFIGFRSEELGLGMESSAS
jgi:hypothetical protein